MIIVLLQEATRRFAVVLVTPLTQVLMFGREKHDMVKYGRKLDLAPVTG